MRTAGRRAHRRSGTARYARRALSDIRGVRHTGLHVRDLAGSVAFYCDLLGLQVLAEREARADYVGEVVGYPGASIRMAWLRHPEGGPIVELLQYVDPAGSPVDTATPNPGTAHLAFSVPDIHATFERLRAAGVAFESGAPVAITAGANRGVWALSACCTSTRPGWGARQPTHRL